MENNNYETKEDFEALSAEIGSGFLDAIKHIYSSGEITEEIHSAITDCIEDMKECIQAYEYYNKKYKK